MKLDGGDLFDHIEPGLPTDIDLFCGVGGVGHGLHSTQTHCTGQRIGVDVDGSKGEQYPGVFIEHDLATGLPSEIKRLLEHPEFRSFDMAWASPPCTFATNIEAFQSGENMIPVARELLEGIPATLKVIENVPGAREHLRNPVQFCGGAFDLEVRKHRVFETNYYCHGTPCQHPEGGFAFCLGDREHPVEEYREAHGLRSDSPLGAKELREVIPPCYVEELWRQYLEYAPHHGYECSTEVETA